MRWTNARKAMQATRSDHARTELVPLAYRSVPLALTANFVCAAAVGYVLWDHIANQTLSVWLAGVLLVSILRLGLWARFQKVRIDASNVQKWAHWLTLGSGAAGVLWGAAGFLLFIPDNPHLHTFLLFVIGGMATGALAVSGPHLPTFHAFFLTSLPPIGVRLFLAGEPSHLMMATLVAFYSLAIFITSLRIGKSFVEVISLEQRLRAVMENVLDGIATMDSSGRIQSANPAFSDMFGYTEKECIGKAFFGDLLPAEYNLDAASERTASGEAWRWGSATSARELVAKRKDQSTFLADVATSSMTYAGENMHIAIVRDITEQKAMQIQLLQASKLATLGQMAAGIAHELNQPLNVIGMAAENALIRQRTDPPDGKYTEEKLKLIAQQSERMGNSINHLRAFSRLDEARTEAFDLEATVHQSIQLVQDQLNIDSILLRTQFSKGPFVVKGHPNQLEHVLLNLLNNARDAILERQNQEANAPEKGQIDIEVFADGPTSMVTVRITDNGPGIGAKDLEQIFDPFFTTKPVGKGTGLGLSIAQGIIQAMGGGISAKNTATGASFEVKLPRSPGEETG